MTIEIINYKDIYEKNVLQLFYKSIFHNRKEFDYARLPSWFHRYSLVDHSIIKLATIDDKIVGSLGLLSYCNGNVIMLHNVSIVSYLLYSE